MSLSKKVDPFMERYTRASNLLQEAWEAGSPRDEVLRRYEDWQSAASDFFNSVERWASKTESDPEKRLFKAETSASLLEHIVTVFYPKYKQHENWLVLNPEEWSFSPSAFAGLQRLAARTPELAGSVAELRREFESADLPTSGFTPHVGSGLCLEENEVSVMMFQSQPVIGLITALPKEFAAMKAMLNNPVEDPKKGRGAGRRYFVGEIPSCQGGTHRAVLCLTDVGNNSASVRATRLLAHYPSVDSIIMVGIAGGVPNPGKAEDHVRLGDIVVSNKKGVVQYDMVKEGDGWQEIRSSPQPPSAFLLEAVRHLEADWLSGETPWMAHLVRADKIRFSKRPSEDTDLLADSDDHELVIEHPNDPHRTKGEPRVFAGAIASANKLLKNPKERDSLRYKFGAKAVEMEGSGVAEATWEHGVGYLVVRGVCDYCDSNKGDDWQGYAAVVAAAYTRALLESMPVEGESFKPSVDPTGYGVELLEQDNEPTPSRIQDIKDKVKQYRRDSGDLKSALKRTSARYFKPYVDFFGDPLDGAFERNLEGKVEWVTKDIQKHGNSILAKIKTVNNEWLELHNQVVARLPLEPGRSIFLKRLQVSLDNVKSCAGEISTISGHIEFLIPEVSNYSEDPDKVLLKQREAFAAALVAVQGTADKIKAVLGERQFEMSEQVSPTNLKVEASRQHRSSNVDKDNPAFASTSKDTQMAALISDFQRLLDFKENRLIFVDHLLPAIQHGDVIPFVGAGMSMPCGFPAWTGFLKGEALRRGHEIHKEVNVLLDSFEYEEAAQVLVGAIGSDAAMNGRLQTHFGKAPGNIDASKAAVRHLPYLFQGPLITTNYDNVLERVYRNRLQVEAGASITSFGVAKRASDSIYLFKLHGRADIAQGRILTKEDYDEHYGLKADHPRGFDPDKRIPSGLRTLFSANSLLFLGCSLAQDRTMLLLEDMMGRGELPHLFALVAEEDDVVAQRNRLDSWGVKAIYYPKGEHEWVEIFLSGVVQILRGASENPQ